MHFFVLIALKQRCLSKERDSGISDAGRRRDREATQKEVDKLRESIQTLTRSANPLGKLMDFLQEDVDAMQRELDTWKQVRFSIRTDEMGRKASLFWGEELGRKLMGPLHLQFP